MSNDNLSKIENTDEAGGIKWLCFFIPLVGLILYLTWQSDRPIAAKECGKFAIIGAAIGFVIGIIAMIISMAMVSSAINDLNNINYNYDSYDY